MAVTPAVDERNQVVLARLTQRRQAIETLIASVAHESNGVPRVSLAQVFERAGNPAEAASENADAQVCRFVYVVKIAEALPLVGKVRARRALADLGLGERTRVGDMSLAQRAALREALT